MQRKLVQIGEHSLLAAIPSTWVKKHGLKKGDYIEFTEVENKLVATPRNEIYERAITLRIPSPSVTWRMLQPVYTSGYDEVRIHFSDPQVLKRLDYLLSECIGFEIVETGKESVTIKSVSKQLDEEFESVLRRTFLIFLQMMDVMQEALSSKDKKRLAEIEALERTVNRYTMFLKRVINRTGYRYPHYVYQIVAFLELASNHLAYIQRRYDRQPKLKIPVTAGKEFKQLHGLAKKIYELYYTYSVENFVWIVESSPHFKWYENFKDAELKHDFLAIAEYLVQIARQVQALHT